MERKSWTMTEIFLIPTRGGCVKYLLLAYVTACLISVLEAYSDYEIAHIAGGREAVANYWPWMASIEFFNGAYNLNYHVCGGSLIGRDVVLTAAHCIFGAAANYTVVLGQHDRRTETSREQKLGVKYIKVHEGYKATDLGLPNDIAIMKLSSPAEFDYYVQPVPLARSTDTFLGNPDCWVTGWGKLSATSYTSVILHEAHMPVIENTDCQTMFNDIPNAKVLDTHICTYDTYESYKTVCGGDSGGPLVCKDDGVYVLAGVTTWGVGSCNSYPSVCTRVSKYRDWISQNL